MKSDKGSIFPRGLRMVRNQGWGVLLSRGYAIFKERFLGRTRMHFFEPRFIKALGTALSVDEAADVMYSFQSLGLRLQPFQEREEIVGFVNLVKDIQPRTILEIGTGFGGTLILFTRAAALDAKIVGLDLPPRPFSISCPKWRESVLVRSARGSQMVSILRGNSHDDATLKNVIQALGGSRLDVLFIDGDHSYDGAKRDFEMYAPLVRRGGMVGFHDIIPNLERPDIAVPMFWTELKARYRHKEISSETHRNGIGVIYWEDSGEQ